MLKNPPSDTPLSKPQFAIRGSLKMKRLVLCLSVIEEKREKTSTPDTPQKECHTPSLALYLHRKQILFLTFSSFFLFFPIITSAKAFFSGMKSCSAYMVSDPRMGGAGFKNNDLIFAMCVIQKCGGERIF